MRRTGCPASKTHADGSGRAGFHTVPAVDTLCIPGVQMGLHAHLAGLGAQAAVGAFVRIDGQLMERELVEGGVDGSQRADVLTERAVEHNRQKDGHRQDDVFLGKEPANRILKTGIRGYQRPAAHEPPAQRAHDHKKADQIEGHAVLPASHDRLQRSDGAGTDGSGAGVAVQAGNTEVLERAFVDLSL